MATVYSVQKTKWDQTTPALKIKTTEIAGRVRIAYGEYEASALTAGDVIEMFNLPSGARVIEGTLFNDALGASTTLAVGHAAYSNADGTAVPLDADEFSAAASSATAGARAIANTLALGAGTVIDADENGYPVTVTLAGAAATGTIVLIMKYVVD
jgi:hypothetical protein